MIAECADAIKSVDRWNWSKTIEFTAKHLELPRSADELSELVSEAKKHVRVVGTAHSFSDIADTDGLHIAMDNMTDIVVDKQAMKVRFGAGVTYTMLIKALKKEGMALPNLPSLPHLNVVGSVVTGTHGGGIELRAMATYV